jgi:hypothetical protein
MRLHRPSPALVVAVIACVLAAGGSSWAAPARQAAATLITGKQVKNESLTGSDIKNGSITGADIKPGSLTASLFTGVFGSTPAGVAGPQGPAGPSGPQGERGLQGEKGDTGTVDTSAFYDKSASDGRFQRRYARIVVVPADGSPAENGQRLVDAVNAVPFPGNDSTQAALVKLEPGRYDMSSVGGLSDGAVRLKPYVDLEGSGQGVTEIFVSGITRTVAVTGSLNSEVRDLRITVNALFNTGIGYLTTVVGGTLRNVHISSNGANAIGVSADAPVTLKDVDITASGPSGVAYMTTTAGTVNDSTLRAASTSGTGNERGISSNGGVVTVMNSLVTASNTSSGALQRANAGSISVAGSIIGGPPTSGSGTGAFSCAFTAKQNLGNGSLTAAGADCS